MSTTIQPRRFLRALVPYIPGKAIAAVQRELGLRSIVKLASNENPLGPSPKALAAFRRATADCALYPEGSSPELRHALARFHRLAPESVIVGNGSDEIIRLLCEAFLEPDDEVIVSQYGFIRFKQQAAMMGGKIIEVPMVDWTHDLRTMGRTASLRTKIVFVANPNNPTGTYNTEAELAELLGIVPASTLVVVDEAYGHFAADMPDFPRTVPGLLLRHPNLVVMRTFSKAYGLAGLRVGYGLADPELVGWLDRIRMPFNVNLPAQRACVEALKDAAFVKRSVALVSKGRESLGREIRSMGMDVLDSAGNFLFVHTPVPGRTLFHALLRRGVIIRPMDEYGLAKSVRITVGTPGQNRTMLKALREVLAQARSAS
ncbi:MAG: histidinol-phosphate transaminase [Elusimicrobia bacterium]|nr:histidinol-phosphate transaminase [Elusimicrobiota bacterium]